MGNLFDALPTELPEELVEILAETPHVRIERIVSLGHSSPDNFWYDQEESEWVLVVRGNAVLRFADGESVSMRAGDFQLIDARRKHRVEQTSEEEPTLWLCVFFTDHAQTG